MATAISPPELENSLSNDAGLHRRPLLTIAFTLGGVGAGLAAFDYFSAGSAFARRGWFAHSNPKYAAPPIYGLYQPKFGHLGWFAIGIALVGAILAGWTMTVKRNVRPVWLLSSALIFMTSFAVAVAYESGDPKRALFGVSAVKDLDPIRTLGIRSFVHQYPHLLGSSVKGVHSLSHPAGRLVLENFLFHLGASHPFRVALALALLGSLALIPTWFLAVRVFDRRVAKIAVLLLAVAPGAVMFSFASFEAVEMTLFAAAIALVLWGGGWEGGPLLLAGVGGFVLGLSTFLTFATGLIVVFLVILVTRRRPFRDAARVLGAASVGGIIALIFLRVAFHYDLLSAYRGSKHILLSAGYLHRPYLYWLIAAPVAWLSMAGLPIAGMGIRELISERPLFLVSLLVPLAAFYALPHSVTGLIPGELERTVMYAYPIAGIVAAGGIVRLAGGSRRLPVLIGILVLAAALQTVLLQYLFFTPF